MNTLLLVGAIALGLACVGFGLAAAAQARGDRRGLFDRGEAPAERATLVYRYRVLSRRMGALALVLMLAAKCAQ